MDRRVTIREVAQKSGVSIATVSDVLNGRQRTRASVETRRRIREAAARLGYVPQRAGRSLRSGLSYHVGLLLSLASERHLSPFALKVIDGALTAVDGTSWMVTTIGYHDEAEKLARLRQALNQRAVDGMVIFDPMIGRECEALLRRRCPFVLVGRSEDPTVHSVNNDNVEAARQATAHFLRAGRRQVAFIHVPLVSTVAVDRLAGYRRALAEADVPERPELIVEAPAYSLADGAKAFERVLDRVAPPISVVAMDDMLALGVIQTAQRRGLKVPGDVGVVGFNDSAFAPYCEPPLTTVRIFAETLTCEATKMLIRLIARQPVATPHVVAPTQLIVRRSCGVAQKSALQAQP